MTNEEGYVHQCEPSDVYIRTDRQRQKFNQKKLEELANSISEVGQISPGLCFVNDEGRTELLVGERRLRACLLAQIPFRYYLKGDEVQDSWLREKIELDENIHREDLTWQERVLAEARVHELFQTKYGVSSPGRRGGHKISDTADYLGKSTGAMAGDLQLAAFVKQVPEVKEAKSKTDAVKIMNKLLAKLDRHEQLEEAKEKADGGAEAAIFEAFSDDVAKEEMAKLQTDPDAEEKPELSPIEKKLMEYDKRCLHGDMLEALPKFKKSYFDVVLFDPPWGVEFDTVKKENAAQDNYSDKAEDFFAALPKWLKLIYEHMSENSHLYMFFGIVHHKVVYDTLEAVGFKTNRIPLIWHKRGAHVTRNPTIWPGRCYEPIAYARKGSKDIQRPGLQDIIETKLPTRAMKEIHPSAKHPEIYRQLLVRSAQPGDAVLDPMSGSGMSLVAADSLFRSHALNWWGIEVAKGYRDAQLFALAKGFDELANAPAFGDDNAAADIRTKSAERKVAVPQTYEGLEIGSPEWSLYWKEHPEEQDAMLEYRKAARK